MKRAWKIVHIAFVALLIALGFLAVTCTGAAIARANGSTKDLLDFAGIVVNMVVAVGTVGAVVAALSNSRKDHQVRAAKDLEAAQLTAAGAAPKLELSHRAAVSALSSVQRAIRADSESLRASIRETETAAGQAIESLESAVYCTFDEIRMMAALPDSAAMQISGAQGRLDIAKSALNEICNKHASKYRELVEAVEKMQVPEDVVSHLVIEATSTYRDYQIDLLEKAHDNLDRSVALLSNANAICYAQSVGVDIAFHEINSILSSFETKTN
ncbi:hypothetical protein ACEPUD_32390 [Burkholderia ubonensis]|uniref:hypothetical protein n=1 Tax=Burkholderia ubonensis TaxID=101571 RepID=UPI00358E75E0